MFLGLTYLGFHSTSEIIFACGAALHLNNTLFINIYRVLVSIASEQIIPRQSHQWGKMSNCKLYLLLINVLLNQN